MVAEQVHTLARMAGRGQGHNPEEVEVVRKRNTKLMWLKRDRSQRLGYLVYKLGFYGVKLKSDPPGHAVKPLK